MTSTMTPPTGEFEQYSSDVYAWAYRLLGRHHDALDVVQDVYIKWARQFAEDQPRRPRGWLRRVTLNRVIDLCRHRDARPKQGDASSADAVADQPAPMRASDAMDQALLRADVVTALGALTDSQRGVLVAKVYDEMTFVQIATEMDVSVSTVKTHYVRAVAAVREKLRHRWGEGDKP